MRMLCSIQLLRICCVAYQGVVSAKQQCCWVYILEQMEFHLIHLSSCKSRLKIDQRLCVNRSKIRQRLHAEDEVDKVRHQGSMEFHLFHLSSCKNRLKIGQRLCVNISKIHQRLCVLKMKLTKFIIKAVVDGSSMMFIPMYWGVVLRNNSFGFIWNFGSMGLICNMRVSSFLN